MTTTPHANLTGSDLHEVKGAAAATAGQVPVANGSGSAPFALLTASSLTGTGNPFGAQLLHLREEQSAGVTSSTATTTETWLINVLNTTKTNEISGASLAANQITLPAGTYYISAYSVKDVNYANNHYYAKLKLRNITASVDLVYGPTQQYLASTNSFLQTTVPLSGRFTLSGTTVLQLQSFVTNGVAPFGYATTGVPEVWADVQIWKVA